MEKPLPPNVTLRLGNLGRVRWEPSWKISPTFFANLADLDLWYIWAGRGHLQMNGREVALKPGVCLLLRPGVSYVGGHDPNDRLGVNYIHFSLEPALSPEQVAALPEIFNVTDPEFVGATVRRIVSLARTEEGKSFAEGLMDQLMRQLLWEETITPSEDAPVSITPEQRSMINEITRAIHEDPGNTPTVLEMAAQAGYSQDHFSRIFRAATEKTPRDYIIDARIDRARQMLLNTDTKIEQIAEALNFNNIYFFSRQFKQRTGQTPTQYRRKATMRWVCKPSVKIP
jgi:AraC-like DNA-binding protein